MALGWLHVFQNAVDPVAKADPVGDALYVDVGRARHQGVVNELVDRPHRGRFAVREGGIVQDERIFFLVGLGRAPYRLIQVRSRDRSCVRFLPAANVLRAAHLFPLRHGRILTLRRDYTPNGKSEA